MVGVSDECTVCTCLICMYVCMWCFWCTHVCICTYMQTVGGWVCNVFVCLRAQLCIRMCKCTYVCMYVYVSVRMHLYCPVPVPVYTMHSPPHQWWSVRCSYCHGQLVLPHELLTIAANAHLNSASLACPTCSNIATTVGVSVLSVLPFPLLSWS